MIEIPMDLHVNKRRLNKLARLFGAAAMLFLYAIGSTQTGYLHQLVHPEEVAALHSATQEQDPCHRSLHHGAGTGCRHEFHLVKLHSCGIIHTLANADIALVCTATNILVLTNGSTQSDFTDQWANSHTTSPLTRGPPSELHA